MTVTPAATVPTEILDDLEVVFGSRDEPVEAVARRAAAVLGHAADRWTSESTFWADVVVDPEYRDEAIAFCAVATGKGRDHEFEYRACHVDGSHRWLYDAVLVLRGARGVPERLRGIMLDVTSWRADNGP